MTTHKSMRKNNIRLEFIITEKRGAEGDEYIRYVNYIRILAENLVPFTTCRMYYLSRDNEDSAFAIIMTEEIYENIAKDLLT